MTIAIFQNEGIGVRDYAPAGPFASNSQFPYQEWRPGEVFAGDGEAEFVYLMFDVTSAPLTLNQGDGLVWDNSYQAIQCLTSTSDRGMSFGTFFLGGVVGELKTQSPRPFSYVFPAVGLYGIWVQRAGSSLVNAVSTAAQGNLAETTTTASQIGAPASATVGSKLISGLYVARTSVTFTANTTNGSAVLTNVSGAKFLTVGQTLSGTGIATGAIVKEINGNAVTMSLAATATGSGITITAANNSFYATTVNGSNQLTNVTSIAGIYPNQTISGTGIPASTTITSIQGVSGNYTITMSANATANGSNINVTSNGYVEALLKWPYLDKTN